jgi:hypothetical protein
MPQLPQKRSSGVTDASHVGQDDITTLGSSLDRGLTTMNCSAGLSQLAERLAFGAATPIS